MRKLPFLLAITLLTAQGLWLLQALSYADTPVNHPQPLLLAFDGFDDDGADDTSTNDIMDGATSQTTITTDSNAEPEETPDTGFHTGYDPDNEQ